MFLKLAFLSLLILSCSKHSDDLPELDLTEGWEELQKPKTVWSAILKKDSTETVSIPTVFYDDIVVVSRAENKIDVLIGYDAISGNILWEWKDYLPDDLHRKLDAYLNIQTFDNYLFIHSGMGEYCIDIYSGNTIWQNLQTKTGWFSNMFENNIIRSYYYKADKMFADSSEIYITSIHDNNWKKIYTLRRNDDYDANVPNASMEINALGDTILYFQVRRMLTTSLSFSGRIDLYAVNVSQNQILYQNLDISISGNSNVFPPILKDNNLYLSGSHELYCFDKLSGELIWKVHYPSNSFTSNFIIHNNLIVYKTDNGYTAALDRFSGLEQWKYNTKICCSYFILQDDILFLNAGNIYIMDFYTGNLYHQLQSPAPILTYFDTRIAIDKKANRMYTTDGYFLHAMKIPDIPGFN